MLGVAVLASVFAHVGGYGTPETFTDGLVPALAVGAVVVGAGSLVSLLIPRKRSSANATSLERDEPALSEAA